MIAPRIHVLYCPNDVVQMRLSKDLNGAQKHFNETRQNSNKTALVHLGFQPLPTQQVAEIFSTHPDAILATGAAVWSLPPDTGLQFLPRPIESLKVSNREVPIFLVSKLWDHCLDLEFLESYEEYSTLKVIPPVVHSTAQAAIPFSGWVATAVRENPDLIPELREWSISTEHDFQSKFPDIPADIGHRIDLIRFEIQARDFDPSNSFRFAAIAPNWLRETRLEALDGITVRLTNVFKNSEIVTVADLANWNRESLGSLKNMGRKSFADLRIALKQTMEAGRLGIIRRTASNSIVPAQQLDTLREAVHSKTLYEHVTEALLQLKDNEQAVLSARLRRDGTKKTLEETGTPLGLGKERVRQLQARATKSIIEQCYWDDVMRDKIDDLLTNRADPLRLEMLEIEDSWFRGFTETAFLSQSIEAFSEEVFRVIKVEGVNYVSRLKQDEWNDLLKRCMTALANRKGQALEKAQVRESILSIAHEADSPELTELLLKLTEPRLHFTKRPDGTTVLAAVGKMTNQIRIRTILDESRVPMHTSEIHQQTLRTSDTSERVVYQTVREMDETILFDRGTYGLRRHIPYTDETLNGFGTFCAELACTQPAKQWSTAELQARLHQNDPLAEQPDKFILEYALSLNPKIRSLGRMTWQSATSVAAPRVNIHEACCKILREEGRPLRAGELKKRLIKTRGLNDSFQLFPKGELIRVERGQWGLAQRDSGLDEGQRSVILAAVLTAVNMRREHGLSEGELPDILTKIGISLPETTTTFIVFELARCDSRTLFRDNRLYLKDMVGNTRSDDQVSTSKPMDTDVDTSESNGHRAGTDLTAHKTCPKCGVSGAIGELFGTRRMLRTTRDGQATFEERAQSYCKDCR